MSDKPPYVQERKGRWFWEPPARFRRSHGLKVVALGADTPAAWAAARKLTAEMLHMPAGAAVAGSVRWMFDQFFGSSVFLSKAGSTQQSYRSLAKIVCRTPVGRRTLGEINARAVRARHADDIHAYIFQHNSKFTAHYAVRLCRRVWKWAHRKEYVDAANPWWGMQIAGVPERDVTWAPEQVDAVVAKASEMGFSSIALAVLAAYSFAHRKGDILTMTWAMVDEEVRLTSKTKVKLPMVAASYPELAAALGAERARQAAAPRQRVAEGGSPFVIECEMTGRAWSRYTFARKFRAVANAAGIPATLQFRDLRASAMTEMADAGTSPLDRSTHGGHKTVKEDRHYSRRTVVQFKRVAQARNEHKNKTKTVDGTSDGTTELFGGAAKK